MILLILLSIFPTLDGHSSLFVSNVSPNDFTNLTVNHPHTNELEWGRLTVRLVKSLGQVVDTNELE
jgi:hypothetical protein